MPDAHDGLEVPKKWQIAERQLTGHSKLYSVFKHKESEAEVHVVPYKTYGLPGFANAHRVTIETPENGIEVVAEGIEVEHPEEAEEVAVEVMQEWTDSE